MNTEQLQDKAYGALYGLAMGDSIGFPAMYHRTLLLNWGRSLLWDFSKQADEQHINKFSLPFTLSQEEKNLYLCGTDDTEFAAVTALILSECEHEPTLDSLFSGWQKYVVNSPEPIWSGVAERASVENAKKGLEPPSTGNDNPHHFDDGAISRAVPIGIKYYGQPERAAEVAGLVASITNAEDGIYAAQAMAASVSVAMISNSPDDIVNVGMEYIPQDSWLGRKVKQAMEILEESGSGFAAIPMWNSHIVNSIYNYGNIAAETLALAYSIFSSTEGRLLEGVQLASLVPKQADSMPAMVGALAGAMQGERQIPSTWKQALSVMKGVCIPQMKGISLEQVVKWLI